MISGMPELEARSVIAARRQGPFTSTDELWRRAKITRRGLNLLAGAAALSSISGDRHQARWAASGATRLPGLLADTSIAVEPVELSEATEAEDMVADYQSIGLTLGCHPMAMLRERLSSARVTRSTDLKAIRNGATVRVAGLVTHRQRPETASGVMFASIEDECGIANLIFWPSIQEEQRQAILASQLMIVQGRLQNEEGVVHVVAQKVHDRTHWLGELQIESRDFH